MVCARSEPQHAADRRAAVTTGSITADGQSMVLQPLGGYTADTLLGAPKHAPLELHLASPHTPERLCLTKAKGESVEHLLLKGLLWALLLPTHPDAVCERDLGLRYRPDVVAMDGGELPVWWGECGSVKASKLRDLALAFPQCRFSVCKWGRSDLRGYAAGLRKEMDLPERSKRAPPFELINFPSDSIDRFLSDDGTVSVAWEVSVCVCVRARATWRARLSCAPLCSPLKHAEGGA